MIRFFFNEKCVCVCVCVCVEVHRWSTHPCHVVPRSRGIMTSFSSPSWPTLFPVSQCTEDRQHSTLLSHVIQEREHDRRKSHRSGTWRWRHSRSFTFDLLSRTIAFIYFDQWRMLGYVWVNEQSLASTGRSRSLWGRVFVVWMWYNLFPQSTPRSSEFHPIITSRLSEVPVTFMDQSYF